MSSEKSQEARPFTVSKVGEMGCPGVTRMTQETIAGGPGLAPTTGKPFPPIWGAA